MCFLNKLHLKKHTQLKEKSLKSLPGTINHVKKWLSFIFDGITFIKLALICNSFTHSELWLIRFALILYTNNDIYLITFATTKETFQVHCQNTFSFFSFPSLCVCVNGWQKEIKFLQLTWTGLMANLWGGCFVKVVIHWKLHFIDTSIV